VKKLFFLLIPGLFIFILTTFTACLFWDIDTECDGTVQPEIEVGIKAVVHVLDKNNNPIPNMELKLFLYKLACGSTSAKGKFDFSGPTNALGIRETTVAYYKLRNSADEVWVDAYAAKLGNGTATANSEQAIYEYADFSAGLTKEVHVYLYRNF